MKLVSAPAPGAGVGSLGTYELEGELTQPFDPPICAGLTI